jgi:hypothetical protein
MDKTMPSPQDKERVGREIESTDTRIDRLVYELSRKGMIYGLNEEEIKIVEGGCPPSPIQRA